MARYGRSLLGRISTTLAALTLFISAASADYPERPIDYVIPFGAGGESGITARLQQSVFKTITGQDIVVKYRPGGGGAVAWSQLNAMTGDGYDCGRESPAYPAPAVARRQVQDGRHHDRPHFSLHTARDFGAQRESLRGPRRFNRNHECQTRQGFVFGVGTRDGQSFGEDMVRRTTAGTICVPSP